MAAGNEFTVSQEISGIVGQSLYGDYNRAKIQYDKAMDYFVHTNPKSMVANTLGAKKGKMGGRKKVGLVTYGLPQSMGTPTFEGADFNDPTTGLSDNPELKPKKKHGRLRFTNDVVTMRGPEFAFVNARTKDIEDGEKAWNLNHIRGLILGSPDVLARVASVAGTCTITTTGRNSRDSDAGDFYAAGTHNHENGMYVGFVDISMGSYAGVWDKPTQTQQGNTTPTAGAAAANTGGVKVASLTRDTASGAGTFVLKDTADVERAPPYDSTSGAYTPAAGDLIITYGSRKGTGGVTYGAEGATTEDNLGQQNGFMPIAAGTQLQGYLYTLSKTTIAGLKGYYDHGSGAKRPFTDRRIQLGLDLIEETGNGMEPDKLLCNKSLRREVVAEHAGEVLYSPVQEAERGFKRLVHVGGDTLVPYYTDRQMLPSVVGMIRSDTWGYWSNRDFTSLPERWVYNKDSFEIPYVQSGNTECTNPSNNGAIDDIADDVFAVT